MFEGCAVVFFRVEDELTRTFERSVNFYHATQRHIPEQNPNSDQHRTQTCQELRLYLIFKQGIPVVFEYAICRTYKEQV
jgi:hypothetical protein